MCTFVTGFSRPGYTGFFTSGKPGTVLRGNGWIAFCFLSLDPLDSTVVCIYHPWDAILSYSTLLSEEYPICE
ncbi:uncharacterized protein N7515_009650 [Penicillium bovifimosum]|uniref:Uncharacterized protein n=1 Tax=Penicillium bovifimosum TaxID=126998 RepID=A0A9W9KVV9_9EURO|nr:uncharacterized protein N7515_009650 [Penicillium bovifimosum]KAJ5121689.1 hypothetical protein N7515_009650 [Penicillium bovifimosum]